MNSALTALIDNAKFNRFHLRTLLLCALIIIFDGYDLVVYGVVLPVLMQEWGLTPVQAGALGRSNSPAAHGHVHLHLHLHLHLHVHVQVRVHACTCMAMAMR